MIYNGREKTDYLVHCILKEWEMEAPFEKKSSSSLILIPPGSRMKMTQPS